MEKKLEEIKINNGILTNRIHPCSVCGELPEFWSCDRLITITCRRCNYKRAFDGVISNKPTDVPVHYEDEKISTTEFYHRFAHEEAIEAWNRRAESEDKE